MPLTIKKSGKSVTVAAQAPYIDLACNTFGEVELQIKQAATIAMALKSYLERCSPNNGQLPPISGVGWR